MFENWFDSRCNFFFFLILFFCFILYFFYNLTRLFNPLNTFIVFPFTSLYISSILKVKFSNAVLFVILVRTIIKVATFESISPMALPFSMMIISFILYATRRSVSTKSMLLSHIVEAFVARTAR